MNPTRWVPIPVLINGFISCISRVITYNPQLYMLYIIYLRPFIGVTSPLRTSWLTKAENGLMEPKGPMLFVSVIGHRDIII